MAGGWGGARPERQRTLEALLDWSYQLLSDGERMALCRLGIFAASFDTETASAALAADDLDAYDVPELVWSLADKSLIVVEPAANATRYRLLDSIRHYARRHLDDLCDTVATAHRLAACYLDRIGPGRVADRWFDNSRASELETLKALVDYLERDDPPTAQSLVIAVDRLHRFASPYLVAIAYVRDALRRLPEPTPMRLELWCRLSYLHASREENATSRGRPSTRPSESSGSPGALRGIRPGCKQRSPSTSSPPATTGRRWRRPCRRWRTAPSAQGRVALQSRAAVAAAALGDLAAAATWFELVLEWSLQNGDTASLGYDYGNLAEIAYRRARPRGRGPLPTGCPARRRPAR